MEDNHRDEIDCIEKPNNGLCNRVSEEDIECEGAYSKKR